MATPISIYSTALVRSPLIKDWLEELHSREMNGSDFSSASTLNIYPHLNYSFGDLGSDLPARLSAKLRISVDSIGRELVRESARYIDGSVTYLEGFLNLRLSWKEILTAEEEGRYNLSKRALVLVGRKPASCSSLSYARVISRAIAQQVLAKFVGVERVILSAAGELQPEDSIDKVREWFIESLTAGAREDHLSEMEYLSGYLKHTLPVSTVWLAHGTLSRGDFRKLVEIARVDGKPETRFITVDRDILKIVGETLKIEELSQLQSDEIIPLILHLASARSGSDIDCKAANLPETSNLLWFAKSVQKRALSRSSSSNVSFEMARGIKNRELLLRAAISYHLDRGQVDNILSAIDSFLRLLMRAFNGPKGGGYQMVSGQDNLTLTSAPLLISDIIRTWAGEN